LKKQKIIGFFTGPARQALETAAAVRGHDDVADIAQDVSPARASVRFSRTTLLVSRPAPALAGSGAWPGRHHDPARAPRRGEAYQAARAAGRFPLT
jgi:hypothetical protein